MAPELRRTRHETAGAGQHDGRETKASTYGTRSSKRKVSEINNPDSSPSGFKSSTNSSQSSLDEVEEPMPPPAKRTRKSSIIAPKTPEEEEIIPDTVEIPSVTVDAPSPVGTDEEEIVPDAPATPKSTRGGFRGRGRGRGRWFGYRGKGMARGGSAAGSRSTPAAESSPSAPKSLGRGRGGHRVKKSDNARIQALYHRRAALKHQYKQVAYFQKAALISVAEKSLDAAKTDPNYHKTFDEYNKTTQALDAVYKKRYQQLIEEYELKKDYLYDLEAKNEEYEKSRYEAAVDEAYEYIEARIMEKVNHVYRQWANGSSEEETEFYRGEDGKIVKRIAPPAPIVHSIATPYNHTFCDIKDPDQFGDYQDDRGVPNYLEQHPRDHWVDMTKQQQESFISKMKKAAFGDKGRGSKIRNTKGSALYQPQAEVLEAPNPLPDLISAAPTPAEVSGDDTETDETESTGEEQPTDQFGVKVPKKPTPRNGDIPQNRIVSEMPVIFDEDEIGIRKHVYRKTNKNDQTYLGMDMEPNPKKAHWDQVARGHNSSKNKKEDLDQELVRAFKVHPTYGLPLPTSVNPQYDEVENCPFSPPTNWQEKLAPTEPVVVLEETPADADLLDEEKSTFLTSRSEWMMRSEDEWKELMPRFKMSAVLEGLGELDRPESRPIILKKEKMPEVSPVPNVIDDGLLRAVNDAEQARAAEAAIPVPAPVPAPAPPPPPSSRGYDPVRDTGYQTPYQPTAASRAPPPPPPPPPPPATVAVALAGLADAAELRAPLPVYRGPTWGNPPPARFQAVQTGQPQPQPSPYYSSFPPVNAPYVSPRAGAPPQPTMLQQQQQQAGPYRELRPAPPNRPPPQQQRAWFGSPPSGYQ